jgi:hypothetical protein
VPLYPHDGRFDVMYAGTGDEERTKAGEIEYDFDGRLRLISVGPEHEVLLREAIRSVNAKERIVELVPPTSGAPLAVDVKATERDDDAFFDALNRYLERCYGFALV